MSRRSSVCALLSVLLVLLLASSVHAQGVSPRWLNSWEKAEQVRKSTGKPTLLYFFNHMARPCKLMQEDTFINPEINKAMEPYNLVALHEQKYNRLFRQYKLFKVPTVIFVDAEGNEIDRAVGYKPASDFLKYLNRMNDANKVARGPEGKGNGTLLPFKKSAMDVTKPGPNTAPVLLTYSNPKAKTVSLVGDFNDWRIGAMPLTKGPTGNWLQTVHLREGVYEYLYVVDDKDYTRDEFNPLSKPNPYGGVNSILKIGNPKTSPIFSGRAATFILYNTEAKKVEVAGSFTNWQPIPLFRKANDAGMWGVRYDLPAGRHEYKYIIDGEWTADPENYTPVKDTGGTLNSSFTLK